MTGLFTNLGQATKPEGQSTVPKLDLGSKSSGGGLFGNLTNNSNNNNQNNPNPSLTNPNAITNPNNQQPANDGKPKPFGNISQASLGTTVSTLESDNKNENPNPNPNPTTNTNTNTTTITNTSIIANSNNNANNTANKPSDNSLAIPSLGRKDAMDSTTKPGLFGSTGSSTGIFGNQNSSNANKPLSSIFGGGSNSQSNGLFGASNSGNSTGNTGLFGNNKK